MSELQLSNELVRSVQTVLEAHDERARDPGIMVQYLAALTGFVLGQQNMDTASKHGLLGQLSAFSKSVLDDVSQPDTPPPAQEAFGIWRAPRKDSD
ncbi:MAG: hypothetical protein P8180_01560 [Gammaproteobacteria bacterium]